MTAIQQLRTRLATAVAVVGVVTIGLVGCTGGEEPTPSPSASASASSSAEATPGLTDVQDNPGAGTDEAGEGLVGARTDVEVATCKRAGESWTVAGTVTNPTDAAADYRIYVSLLAGTTDTRALVQVDVDGVEAGAASEWSTDIAVAEDDLECVLRVERYAA